ncbi:hypothetical protein [Sphingomonas spermidinifaciens]|uniref:hypothetical protein n=1 Tax=Sphingomonas spermidinifaciens TaxID=1141889 RepID=UPI001596C99C|nr:hypothetical protein [Sphingomonas spermidinifaciens]
MRMQREDDRAARLAEALRANLRRRKAQARQVAGEQAAEPIAPASPPAADGD